MTPKSTLLSAFALAFSFASGEAALLTTFTDDFNRADGSLGSNYTLDSGSAYTIVSNTVQRGSGSDLDLTTLNVGTLPTALDYANGYSFSASLDLYFDTQATSRLLGFTFNYTDANNWVAFAIRGDSNNAVQARGMTGGVDIGAATVLSGFGGFTNNTWYTLAVTSSAAGVYDLTLSLQGSGTPLKTGTYNALANTVTGGEVGFYANVPGSNQYYDNLSVSVVPEPSSMLLCLAGAGALVFSSRRMILRKRA